MAFEIITDDEAGAALVVTAMLAACRGCDGSARVRCGLLAAAQG